MSNPPEHIWHMMWITICKSHHVSNMTCFPSDSQLRSFHDSLHGESRICLSHHRENGNSNTETKTTRQENSVTSERQTTRSDPSRIQSNISKIKTENSHECYMNAEIGLSKTQSYESCFTQPHSQSILLHTLQNSGQIQGNGEWTSSWNESSYSLNHGKSRSVWWMNLELEWHQLFFSPSKFFTADKNQSFQDKILSRFCALNWVTLSDLPGLSAPKQP